MPTSEPSNRPSGQPSSRPSGRPSSRPSGQPSSRPTSEPSGRPTSEPSNRPSGQPSSRPSGQPSSRPTSEPSGRPSGHPSSRPSSRPSRRPTSQPSGRPSVTPTSTPTKIPTTTPTAQPSAIPTSPSGHPTSQPTSIPSTSLVTALSFSSQLQFKGINKYDWDNDKKLSVLLLESFLYFGVEYVSSIIAEDITSRRLIQEDEMVCGTVDISSRTLLTKGLKLVVSFTYPVDASNNDHSQFSAIVTTIKTQMSNASTDFIYDLKQYSSNYQSVVFDGVLVDQYTIQVTRSPHPTSSPTATPSCGAGSYQVICHYFSITIMHLPTHLIITVRLVVDAVLAPQAITQMNLLHSFARHVLSRPTAPSKDRPCAPHALT